MDTVIHKVGLSGWLAWLVQLAGARVVGRMDPPPHWASHLTPSVQASVQCSVHPKLPVVFTTLHFNQWPVQSVVVSVLGGCHATMDLPARQQGPRGALLTAIPGAGVQRIPAATSPAAPRVVLGARTLPAHTAVSQGFGETQRPSKITKNHQWLSGPPGPDAGTSGRQKLHTHVHTRWSVGPDQNTHGAHFWAQRCCRLVGQAGFLLGRRVRLVGLGVSDRWPVMCLSLSYVHGGLQVFMGAVHVCIHAMHASRCVRDNAGRWVLWVPIQGQSHQAVNLKTQPLTSFTSYSNPG